MNWNPETVILGWAANRIRRSGFGNVYALPLQGQNATPGAVPDHVDRRVCSQTESLVTLTLSGCRFARVCLTNLTGSRPTIVANPGFSQ